MLLTLSMGGDICKRKQTILVVTELELELMMITESELANELAGAYQ